eukprot:CAMPEP_0178464656 /NCGR_PEP_ID=MMETSP0689_2-20121128/50954_1 /TAXON_ID=160604 /ORGANISM="Amphidinium massartii, Strain CS-259" /LENGTH=41 /DNA_ID= /DNA_START= /DNA_END= /DNA_ORIENTATION=
MPLAALYEMNKEYDHTLPEAQTSCNSFLADSGLGLWYFEEA